MFWSIHLSNIILLNENRNYELKCFAKNWGGHSSEYIIRKTCYKKMAGSSLPSRKKGGSVLRIYMVLFLVHREEHDSVLNSIIASAKRFIWQQKFSNNSPNIQQFSKYFLKYLWGYPRGVCQSLQTTFFLWFLDSKACRLPKNGPEACIPKCIFLYPKPADLIFEMPKPADQIFFRAKPAFLTNF